jgi:hypothetical protein
MLKKAPYFILLLVVVVFACSKKAKQDLKKSEKFTNGKPIEYEVEANDKFADIAVYTKMQPYLDSIATLYDSVFYFCDLDTNFFFYVKTGNKNGVVDKNANVIIPVEYSKVYSPGGTVKGYIEVEKNGKRGLYDFFGTLAAPVKYNSIYPSTLDDVLAQVKLDSLFGTLNTNGTEVFDTTGLPEEDYFKSPFVSQAATKWKFDVNDEDVLFLQPVGFKQYEDERVGRAVVITPSYIADLGFFPPIVQYIVVDKDADFGIAESKGKVEKVTGLWNNIVAAITEYYEVGLDARGYETEKNNLITLNSSGDVIGKAEFYRPFMPTSPCGNNDLFSNKFIDSSLFEVKTYIYSAHDGVEDETYYSHDHYYYYAIAENGEINELKSNRRFAFTQFVVIDESYFEGCYANPEKSEREEGGVNNKAITRSYLSVEDLEVMKNEIFADYGYIFTKPKWRTYFGSKKWYKGVVNNVDHLLTDVDKQNITFINATLEKMKAKPNDYNKTKEGSIYLFP